MSALVMLFVALGDLWSMIPAGYSRRSRKCSNPKTVPTFSSSSIRLPTSAGNSMLVALASAAALVVVRLLLWRGRMVAPRRSCWSSLSIRSAFVSRGLVEAEDRRDQELSGIHDRSESSASQPADKLVLYGGFNSDAVVFYRGGPVEIAERPARRCIGARSLTATGYIITTEKTWKELQQAQPQLAPPLLRSRGKGPEGDAPLVLVRGGTSVAAT